MKKRIVFWISLLIMLISLSLLSGLVHSKAESWLKNKLISMLPEGSTIKSIEWNILSLLKVDSVILGDFGYLDSVEVSYTPFGILRRRFKNVSIYQPKLYLSFSHSREGKERNIPGLFYIEVLSILNGYIEWEGHEFLIDGSGRLFSTKSEISLDIFQAGGLVDSLGFNLSNGRLDLERVGSLIDIRELQIGHSKLRVFGQTDSSIKGEGRISLKDLRDLWDIDGEGVVEIEFVYDSLFRFKGKSGPSSILGISLKPITFQGTTDSIWISTDAFRGYLKNDGKISCGFELSDLNMKDFKKDLPTSKLNGTLDFTYSGSDSFSVKSSIFGNVMDSYIREFNIDFMKLGERVIITECEGYVDKGKLFLNGEYNGIIKGNLLVDKLEISPLLEYLGVTGRGLLDVNLNLQDKVYGVFSIDNLQYGSIEVGYVDGNIDLLQNEKKFLGELTFVIQDVGCMSSKLFEIGECVAIITENDAVLIGLFKREDNQIEYSLQISKDDIKFEKLNIAYPGGWLMLSSPFSAIIDKGMIIEEAVLKDDKDERVKISFDFEQDKLSGEIELDKFDLSILQAFCFTTLPLSGNLSGFVTLSGKTNAPLIEFKGNSRAKWKGEAIGDSLYLELGYRNGKIKLNDITIFEKSHHSRFNGSVDVINDSLDIKAEFNRGGSWIFYPMHDYMDTRQVEVNGMLNVKGGLPTPEVYGEMNVLKGNILLVKPGIRIEDLSANIEFNGDKAFLKSSRVFLSEGNIDAKGSFDISKRSYSFKINITKAPLNWQYVNSIIDGNLIWSKEEKIMRIEGEIDFNKTIITMPFRKGGNGAARPGNLYLDIKFDAGEGNVWIRNDMADMELMGEIDMKYDGGPMFLSGNLSVKQGNFYYLYRSFDVVKGEFNFKNSPELNPNIDIQAKTIVQEKDTVFLDILGTMRMPEFELYSKPARSVADIMTLLNLNLYWEDLSSLKAIEESITEAAFNYWVRQTFSRRFKERFGIDLVQMRGESGHYEIVLGKYITDRLFVKARTDILSYGISEIQAEYRLRRWGSIIAENDLSGDTRLLFKIGWRY